MRPKLYMSEPSPVVRAVLMTAKAIDLELELKEVDLASQEHLTPEYLKLNPLHTVPTLEDNGFVIFDSHAINTYIVTKYAKNDSLYPKDPQKRAIIDQRLHFDTSLFDIAKTIVRAIIWQQMKKIPEESIKNVKEAISSLEKLLGNNKYMAGDGVTLADIHLMALVTTINVIIPIDSAEFPKISAWMLRMKKWPSYEANLSGLGKFTAIIENSLSS